MGNNLTNEYGIPNEFYIFVPDDADINAIDRTQVLNMKDDYPDENTLTVSLKNIDNHYCCDDEVFEIMVNKYGITNFNSLFDECQENMAVLLAPMTIQEVIDLYVSHGLSFAGFVKPSMF